MNAAVGCERKVELLKAQITALKARLRARKADYEALERLWLMACEYCLGDWSDQEDEALWDRLYAAALQWADAKDPPRK